MKVRSFVYSLVSMFIVSGQAVAITGPGAVPDHCGLVNPVPGQTFNPSQCKYPNIGTIIADYRFLKNLEGNVDPSLGLPANANNYAGICTGTIIHVDDKKAVFLTASHCLYPEEKALPLYLNFEPQPTTQWSSDDFGNIYHQAPLRPYTASSNLIPIAKAIQHPNGLIGGAHLGNDMMLVLIDLVLSPSNPVTSDQKTYLKNSIQPIPIAPSVNYLNTFSNKELSRQSFVAVGFNRLENMAICEVGNPYCLNGPTYSTAGQKVLIPAKHDRKWAPLIFESLDKGNIKLKQNVKKSVDGICNGDSGGPIIMDGYVVGVGSAGSGAFCLQGPAWYQRVDWSANYDFIQCALNPNATVQQVEDCVSSRTFK